MVRAAPLTRAELDLDFASQYLREERVVWHDETASVRGIRRTMLGALTVEETAFTNIPPAAIRDAHSRRGRQR